MKGFSGLIEDIREGKYIDQADILPYLCSESREERSAANAKLAHAYFHSGNFDQARIFIQRSWILSEFSSDLLPLYLDIHAAIGDMNAIKEAYKRLGMKEAARGRIIDAIRYFSMSMYTYAKYQNLDKYEYDFDILERIEKMAEHRRFREYFQTEPLPNRKIRLAYLVFGMTHTNSVLVKIDRIFAQYHDKDRFEVAFFMPEKKSALSKLAQAKDNIKIIRDYNCKVIVPDAGNDEERLFEIATQIHNYQADILIANALLADLTHYFIASLRPAPLIIGFVAGPPPQFVSHSLDWGITWTKHPLLDAPCDCSLVDLEVELPVRDNLTFYRKQQFNIPEESFVLMSGGRYTKFQEPAFWNAIIDIMRDHVNVYYVVVGPTESEIPLLSTIVPTELKARLRFVGWREDFLKILGLADTVLDTFPSGGGLVLMDAMALGIPVVSFKNNYMKLFDQTDWSPAEEIIPVSELIVDRGNYDHFKLLVTKLIDDREYRTKIAEICKKQIFLTKGNPEKMVRRFESIYIKVLGKKLRHNISNKNQLSGLDEIENKSLRSNLRKIQHKIKEKLIRYVKLF